MFELDWKNPNLKTGGEPDKNKGAKISVPDQSVVSNAASIRFTGRGAANYGEIQQENLMRVLENFADTAEPLHPTVGQTWYNADAQILMMCVAAGDVRLGEPPVWQEVGGIIITEVDAPGPIAKRAGQFWYQKTGPLTGILHISTLSGRYPATNTTIGGWEQIYPAVETIAGRDEYDYVLELVNLLADVSFKGSGATLSILSVIDNLAGLDIALRAKNRATPDKNLLKIGELAQHLKIQPNSQDWDQLLAGARYAINRLEVPDGLPDEISRQPFVQDGRIVAPLLSSLEKTNIRYPAIERLANRRAGIVSLVRFYASTINALKVAIKNRYSLRGINDSVFGPHTRVRHHITFSGSQAGKGDLSIMKMRFNFVDKNEMDRFLFAACGIQLAVSHRYNGTAANDAVFKELFETRGVFRFSNDDTRTLSGSPLVLAKNTSKVGIEVANIGGEIVNTETLASSVITLRAYAVSDRQFALEATLKASGALIGVTSFKFSIIEDIEMHVTDTGSVRIYPSPKTYMPGDGDGTSPWFTTGEKDPDPEYPPRGQLIKTLCISNDKVGVYANGTGGTYSEVIQSNSPECLPVTPCEGELKAAGSILIPGVATGITLVGHGAPGSTVYGGTEYFYSGANGNNAISFKGTAITFAEVAQGGAEVFSAPPGEFITATVGLTYRSTSDTENKTLPVRVTGIAGSNGTITLSGNAEIASTSGTVDRLITVTKMLTFTKTDRGAPSIKKGADTNTMIDSVSIKVFSGSSTLEKPVQTSHTERFPAKTGGRVLSFSVPPDGLLRYSFCEFLPPEHPPRGEKISEDCVGTSLVGTYTNGTGGTYTDVIQENSPTCSPCQGTVSAAGTSTIKVPAGVTAVDFVGAGTGGTTTPDTVIPGTTSPDTVIPGVVNGYKYTKKGAPYVEYRGTYVANLSLGAVTPNELSGPPGSSASAQGEVSWTQLPGATINVGGTGQNTKTAYYSGNFTGEQTITLRARRNPFVVGGTSPEESADVEWTAAQDYTLTGTTKSPDTIIPGTTTPDTIVPGTTTPGQDTTATIGITTVTFAGSATSTPPATSSRSISISNNVNGVNLTVNKPVGGSLTYSWCSYVPAG